MLVARGLFGSSVLLLFLLGAESQKVLFSGLQGFSSPFPRPWLCAFLSSASLGPLCLLLALVAYWLSPSSPGPSTVISSSTLLERSRLFLRFALVLGPSGGAQTQDELTALWRLARWSPLFAFLWLAANYFFFVGLTLTAVSSAVAIEQSTTVFVFALSLCFLHEKATVAKVVAVAVCVGGVVAVALGDSGDSGSQSDSWIGDVVVLGTGACAAMYMVFFARLFAATEPGSPAGSEDASLLVQAAGAEVAGSPMSAGEKVSLEPGDNDPEDSADAPRLSSTRGRILGQLAPVLLWLSLVGWSSALFGWPVFFLVHGLGLEESTPGDSPQVALTTLSLLFGVGFNLILNWGLIVTTPLFMRLALSVSIPASFLIDVVSGQESLSWLRLLGTAAVFAGFVGFQWASSGEER
jgi:drug/metabolite transporter (DMT)-like permease